MRLVLEDEQDAQGETPRTRTNQEKCWNSHDGRCCERTGQDSVSFWCQSFSTIGDDRARTNSFNRPRVISLGGTIQQLINETRQEIEEVKSRNEKLHKRLSELEELFIQLQSNPENHLETQ